MDANLGLPPHGVLAVYPLAASKSDGTPTVNHVQSFKRAKAPPAATIGLYTAGKASQNFCQGTI